MTDYKPIKEDDPTVFAKPKGAIDIPEARNLSWEDTFYDKETDIVAVFDMDEEAHKRLTKRRHTIMMYCFAFYALSLGVFLYGPNAGGFFFSAYMFCFVAWLGFKMHVLRKAQESAMEEKPEAFGVHVAVTRTGIRKDVYNIPFGGIFKTTTVMPFEDIESVEETAPGCSKYCCSTMHNKGVLVKAKIDKTPHLISHLKNSEDFISLVNAMMASQEDVEANK